MRQTSEEKMIARSQLALEDIGELYNEDSIVALEYTKLAKGYKRLYNRYTKIIKINDCHTNDTIKQNEFLQESIEYTIKTARNNYPIK